MKKGPGVVFILVMVMLITLTGANRGASAYTVAEDDEPVHEYIVERAALLINNPKINNVMEIIKAGAGHEDLKDHVTDRRGDFTTLSHFWDADKGDDDPVDMIIVGEDGINAWIKAQTLWGMALGQYADGDYGSAYEYLGHVAHLLGDMSVPAHAHEDAHADDIYEDWMTLDNALLSTDDPWFHCDEIALLQSQGPWIIPEGVDPLFYLFYTMNQIADYLPSDGYDGDDDTRPGLWMDDIYNEFGLRTITSPLTDSSGDLSDNDWGDNNDDGDISVIRHYCFLNAIRATATLLQLFQDTADSNCVLTVVIDHITAQDCHDEGSVGGNEYADFFSEVNINGFSYRNEGDQVVDDDDIAVHWAFARNVGISGLVPVVISIWDDDDNANDPSSIDPVEDQRDLDLFVDLATGMITGDISGICGTPLSSTGNSETNDSSQIWFRVLLPNIPPTVQVGEDQTVDEGDLVTLTGSFTDPNTDDSWTYLWHMESSTNCQVVPDATGSAEPNTPIDFTFIPCDNGVYTFSLTVTDSYGASDTDEVVVTVLNVPPVVSAPYISNQENAEFILPMVHNTSFNGTFTDAGTCDTHTALWDWGDGNTSNGIVTETDGSGSVTNSHTYSQPGDYTVTLTVTDDDGGSDSKTMNVHVADVDEALDIFNDYIQSLPNSKFKKPADQRKKAFDNIFSALQDMWADQEYQGMISSLNSNMRTKFDGMLGGSPKDDWIKQDLAVQAELCQKVDDITNYLQYLLSTML